MADNKQVKTVLEYAAKFVEERLDNGAARLCLRCDSNSMYVTKVGVELKDLTEQDIVRIELNKAEGDDLIFAAILTSREDINAIATTYSKYVCATAKAKAIIPAVLDDMAQIVGATCKTCANDVKSILKTIKGKNSCLIENEGALTTGRTMAEAFTCAMVLDKAATIYVCSSVIGGPKVLGLFDCKLMRFVYKTKYSKKNVENNKEKEGE